MIQKWQTDKDLAAWYGVSRQTVWRWVREGLLPPPVRIGRRSVRWDGEQIAKHDAERQRPPA